MRSTIGGIVSKKRLLHASIDESLHINCIVKSIAMMIIGVSNIVYQILNKDLMIMFRANNSFHV